MSNLTIDDDAQTLDELEQFIDAAIAKQGEIFMAIGAALLKIRERRLYGHSFERYVKALWLLQKCRL